MDTIEEAVSLIKEEGYPFAENFDKPHTRTFAIGDLQNPPALYLSKADALDAFVNETLEYLYNELEGEPVRFIDGPHLDRWNITVQSTRGVHRMAEVRYSVVATLGVVG